MPAASRSRLALFLLCAVFVFAAMSVPACKRNNDAAIASARRTLDEIRAQVEAQQTSLAAVRKRYSALPEDLPDLEPVRHKLSTLEEVMGVERARVEWLTGELNKAAASKDQKQLQEVLETIANTAKGSKDLGKPVLELTHQLMPFERVMAQIDAMTYKHTLPTGFEIKAALAGIERQLIEFIEDKTKKVDKKTWFRFDRLAFVGTGSDLDMGASKDQIDKVAAILKAYPQVKLEIGGYTDNTGPAAASKKLSAAQAAEVKSGLVIVGGIPAPRLASAGYGPADPVCPANDTDDCKAQNRRIAARVTAK